jgi:predicted ATPase
MQAHYRLGVTLYWLGELVPARAHLEQEFALYISQRDHSLTGHALSEVPCLAYAAFTLWMLGYPDQALTRSQEMFTLAQELSHAYSLARALYYAAMLHGLRREWSISQERAEAALTLSTEQGFALWVGNATFQRGLALAMQGQGEAGIVQMRQGLAARGATGQRGSLSAYHARLAEAYGGIGQAEKGLSLVVEALAHVGTTDERYSEAEIYRIKGELLLRQAVPDAVQAEACFCHALAIARRQQAKSWELRAATSLARLWQHQGKRAEAHQLLAEIYAWFTEGFDTADLQEARALLDTLEKE